MGEMEYDAHDAMENQMEVGGIDEWGNESTSDSPLPGQTGCRNYDRRSGFCPAEKLPWNFMQPAPLRPGSVPTLFSGGPLNGETRCIPPRDIMEVPYKPIYEPSGRWLGYAGHRYKKGSSAMEYQGVFLRGEAYRANQTPPASGEEGR